MTVTTKERPAKNLFGRVLRTGLSRLRRLAASRLARSSFNPSRCRDGHFGGVYLGYDPDEDAMRRYCLRCHQSFLEYDKPGP